VSRRESQVAELPLASLVQVGEAGSAGEEGTFAKLVDSLHLALQMQSAATPGQSDLGDVTRLHRRLSAPPAPPLAADEASSSCSSGDTPVACRRRASAPPVRHSHRVSTSRAPRRPGPPPPRRPEEGGGGGAAEFHPHGAAAMPEAQPTPPSLLAGAVEAGQPEEGLLRPAPPGGAGSWDWPLSRHESKARVLLLDRLLQMADREELLGKLEELEGAAQQAAAASSPRAADRGARARSPPRGPRGPRALPAR